MLFQVFQCLVAFFFHDTGPWIIGYVDPVSKAHQSEWVMLVLCLFNKGRGVSAAICNFLEHFHNSLVGSSVQWAPEGGYTG